MTARQVLHLPWTDVDLNGLKLVLEEWSRKGFEGDLDRRSLDSGLVTITTKNWLPSHPGFVMMELHKLDSGKGWFGRKTNWVVQLYSCYNMEGALAIRQGCVNGQSILGALDNGLNDVGNGFLSTASLESMGIESANIDDSEKIKGIWDNLVDTGKQYLQKKKQCDPKNIKSSADAKNELERLVSETGDFQAKVKKSLADCEKTKDNFNKNWRTHSDFLSEINQLFSTFAFPLFDLSECDIQKSYPELALHGAAAEELIAVGKLNDWIAKEIEQGQPNLSYLDSDNDNIVNERRFQNFKIMFDALVELRRSAIGRVITLLCRGN